MISKFIDAMFLPKYPRGYTGRHRAEFALARAAKPATSVVAAAGSRHATV